MKKTTFFSSAILLTLLQGATLPLMAQDQRVTLRTTKAVGSEMTFKVNDPNVTVDWGDGNLVKAQSTEVTGTVKGENIVIYGNNTWSMIDCSNCELSVLSITMAPNMQTLICRNNSLEGISLIKSEKLQDLDCSYNNIKSLSLLTCTSLERLNASNNALSGPLSISSLKNLQYINVANNALTSVSVSGSSNLDMLNCSNNQISSLDLSKATKLTSLVCHNNKISSINFSSTQGVPALVDIVCDNNQLKTLNLQNSSVISNISCTNNQLTQVVLASKPDEKPYSYLCSNNYLSLKSFSTSYGPTGENLQFMPQNEYDISSYTLYDSNAGNYVLSQNSAEGATTMAMSEERKDADGSFYNKIGFYAVENGETTELVKGTDYKESGNGNYTFLKEFTHVYGKITNSRVDNVYVQTTPFTVVKEMITGITNVEGNNGLVVNTADGCIVISSTKATPVKIYAVDGRLVWKGVASSTPQSISLNKGVYIVGKQKVSL